MLSRKLEEMNNTATASKYLIVKMVEILCILLQIKEMRDIYYSP